MRCTGMGDAEALSSLWPHVLKRLWWAWSNKIDAQNINHEEKQLKHVCFFSTCPGSPLRTPLPPRNLKEQDARSPQD